MDMSIATVRPRLPSLLVVLAATTAFAAALSGCARGDKDGPGTSLRIAEQFGLAYAPLTVAREYDLLEHHLPDTDIEWVQLGNASAIREAMLAGRLDVGFMGIPPFLIGADRGMGWKVFTGLSMAPLELVTFDADLASLEDLEPQHRIALPQPGSIQHILLSMAASRRFGDPTRFDNQLVTLAHPDAMTALLAQRDAPGSGRSGIAAHFSSPPYVFEELELEGSRSILSGREAFGGEFTFIVGVLAPGFGDTERKQNDGQQGVLAGLAAALAEAMILLETPDSQLLGTLAAAYDVPRETVERYLAHPELVYTGEIVGMETFLAAMIDFGYLDGNVRDSTSLIHGGSASLIRHEAAR